MPSAGAWPWRLGVSWRQGWLGPNAWAGHLAHAGLDTWRRASLPANRFAPKHQDWHAPSARPGNLALALGGGLANRQTGPPPSAKFGQSQPWHLEAGQFASELVRSKAPRPARTKCPARELGLGAWGWAGEPANRPATKCQGQLMPNTRHRHLALAFGVGAGLPPSPLAGSRQMPSTGTWRKDLVQALARPQTPLPARVECLA
ncbi:hypothetical protein SELMODRAFT_419736 [Selaginella moellendorffii]|uniref:Uncharacterized protein n=1 Tax=Selaginella moellendorffii TaxID=88036 RepID=D8S9W0_SELML|nr:hypothetical protein SELMODRAFT_419736 [Selaginella moellendorffii]